MSEEWIPDRLQLLIDGLRRYAGISRMMDEESDIARMCDDAAEGLLSAHQEIDRLKEELKTALRMTARSR